MNAEVRKAIGKTLLLEGGYVNDPDDPGGETKFGISKRSHPDVNIQALTQDQAAEILFREYWLPLNIDAYPIEFAWKAFDIAVNQGVSAAKAMLEASATVEDLIELQVKRYVRIVRNTPTSTKFLAGWINRAFERLTP